MQSTIKERFDRLRNRTEIVVEPDHTWLPISKEKIDIFEKLITDLLNNTLSNCKNKISIPTISPTEDGGIWGEWFLEDINEKTEQTNKTHWVITLELTGERERPGEIATGGFTLHALDLKTKDCIFECYYYNGDYAYTINDDDSIFVENDKNNLINKLQSFWL